MKKKLRKRISVYNRDLWDNQNEYNFWALSSNKLKHMLKHKPKRDRRIEGEIMRVLKYRGHVKRKQRITF